MSIWRMECGVRHWHYRILLGALLIGCASTAAASWSFDLFLESETRYRVSDELPDGSAGSVGMSMGRIAMLFDGEKRWRGGLGPFDLFQVNFKTRASYDAVHDINSNTYGKDAGRSICLEDTSGLISDGCVPHGQGAFGGSNLEYGAFFLFPGRFGFDIEQNPNEGMIILGEPLHQPHGGVAFGAPVRPCDIDRRGCLDGYMDRTTNGLRFREFAEGSRMDWLREFVIRTALSFDSPFDEGRDRLVMNIGHQQVIWGRTDLFRVLDVVNPVDYSRNNIYDEETQIRHPQWIATAEYQAGALGLFQDFNLQILWKFDKFRPTTLGQCGMANNILAAGCFFRGMKNLWDNGGTVANFALNPPIVGSAPPGIATDFGPNQVGIRRVDLPNWNLSDTELGFKLEGILKGTSFSLNGMLRRQDLPALRGGLSGPPSVNPFLLAGAPEPTPHLVAFDIAFPRTKMLGGSADFTIDALNTIHRLEATITWGEEVPNTLNENLFSETRVLRYVVGIDRLTFLPWTGTDRTWILSFQTFGQHFLDHELEQREFGPVGVPWFKDNWISTFLAQGFYMRDRLVPQFVTGWDWRAGAGATRIRAEYHVTNRLRLRAGVNFKWGTNQLRHVFNDGRDANPYPPFSAYPGQLPGGLSQAGNPVGVAGIEPLGRFRMGPLGTSRREDEFFFNVQYQVF